MIRRLLCRLGRHRWVPTRIEYLDGYRLWAGKDAWLLTSFCGRPGCCERVLETRAQLDGLPVDLIVSGYHQRADAQDRAVTA